MGCLTTALVLGATKQGALADTQDDKKTHFNAVTWGSYLQGQKKKGGDSNRVLFCVFNAPMGEWDNARNWREKTYPDDRKCDFAHIDVKTGCTLNISKARRTFPPVLNFTIGCWIGDMQTQVYVNAGASIRAYRVGMPAPITKGVDARLHLNGGELRVGEPCRLSGRTQHFHDSLIEIGCNATYSGQGTLEVRDGLLSGVMHVGADLPMTNVGVLRVIGSSAKISAPPKTCSQNDEHIFKVRTFGSLEFILTDTGVSPLEMSAIDVEFSQDARIYVDATQYRGKVPNSVMLLSARRIKRLGNIRIECVDSKDCTTEIVFTIDNKIMLNLR